VQTVVHVTDVAIIMCSSQVFKQYGANTQSRLDLFHKPTTASMYESDKRHAGC